MRPTAEQSFSMANHMLKGLAAELTDADFCPVSSHPPIGMSALDKDFIVSNGSVNTSSGAHVIAAHAGGDEILRRIMSFNAVNMVRQNTRRGYPSPVQKLSAPMTGMISRTEFFKEHDSMNKQRIEKITCCDEWMPGEFLPFIVGSHTMNLPKY
jgi:hypothetical protein